MRAWDGTTSAYEQSFGALCSGTIPRLLDDTDAPGGRHLDVGCGTGELAREAVRRGRSVTAVDPASSMVARAEQRLHGTGRVLQASLPGLPFPDDAFDAATANFVVNHVPHPLDAVRALRRVVRAGGAVAMTVWPAGGAGWQELVGEVFAAAGARPLPSAHLPPELDFPRSPEGLAALAARAGLEVRVAQPLGWEWAVRPEALWAGIAGGIATPGETYRAQKPPVRDRIAEEFRARAALRASADGLLRFPITAAYVLARPTTAR